MATGSCYSAKLFQSIRGSQRGPLCPSSSFRQSIKSMAISHFCVANCRVSSIVQNHHLYRNGRGRTARRGATARVVSKPSAEASSRAICDRTGCMGPFYLSTILVRLLRRHVSAPRLHRHQPAASFRPSQWLGHVRVGRWSYYVGDSGAGAIRHAGGGTSPPTFGTSWARRGTD